MRVVCYCDYGAYGYCCAIGVIHTGAKSGCELVTLLSCLWYDKLWGPSLRVVTLFEVFHCTSNVNCKTLICNKGSICFILNDIALKLEYKAGFLSSCAFRMTK